MHNKQLKQYYLLKGHNMNTINLSQIQVSINKTALNNIISDILASENNGALLKSITPHLAGKFPQFQEFTNVSIENIDENGAATVVLKIPRTVTAKEVGSEGEQEQEPVSSFSE